MSQVSAEIEDWSNMLQRFPFKWWRDYVLLYLIKAYFVTSFPVGFYVEGENRNTSILFERAKWVYAEDFINNETSVFTNISVFTALANQSLM